MEKTVQELYSEACEQHKIKNYDAVFKILDEIKRRDPEFKRAYYLEAWTWECLGNSVKQYYALEKILPLLNFSAPEEKSFATEVLLHIGDACAALGLLKEAKEFFALVLKMRNPPDTKQAATSLIFHENFSENSTPDSFRALYDEYKKILVNIKPYPKKFYAHKKIRVGFLSADFKYHPVINWSWSLLTGLDKNLFDTYFYSNVENPDVVTEH